MKYIGIDIGDGESAVTVVSEHGPILPAVVTLGNVKNIRSIVGTLNDRPVIGDQVVLNYKVKDRSARFKSQFLYKKSATADLERFARGLYELIDSSLTDKNWQIALGCPAAWTDETRERYAKIVSKAGFQNVHTVSESRAAFLYAHYANELHLSPETLKRSTLVVDIGSSTLDYAYIVGGRERDVGVFGEFQLGGGILDGLILDYAIENAPNRDAVRAVLESSPSWKNYCELIARKLKEEYFLNESAWAQASCIDTAPIYADPNSPLSLQIILSSTIMNQLLNQKLAQLDGKSFCEALAASMERAKEITDAQPVEVLIVTGGASRMQFFQQLCKDTFPNAQIILCEEPEFSIARGLGIAARTDEMLRQFREKIAGFFTSGVIEMEVERQIPYLLPNYIPAISKILTHEGVLKAILEFSGNTNGGQLESFIEDRIGNVIRNRKLTQEADQIINTWIAERMTGIQNRLGDICNQFQIDPADMSLVNIHADVTKPNVQIPLYVKLFAALSKIEWLNKLITMVTTPQMTKRMQNQLNKKLSEPNGEFIKELSHQLVQELQHQINLQTQNVEIQIH